MNVKRSLLAAVMSLGAMAAVATPAVAEIRPPGSPNLGTVLLLGTFTATTALGPSRCNVHVPIALTSNPAVGARGSVPARATLSTSCASSSVVRSLWNNGSISVEVSSDGRRSVIVTMTNALVNAPLAGGNCFYSGTLTGTVSAAGAASVSGTLQRQSGSAFLCTERPTATLEGTIMTLVGGVLTAVTVA